MPRTPAKFQWDAEKRQYRYESGRAVPSSRVEGWIDKATLNAETRLGNLTQNLVDGKTDIFDWKLAMKDEIKNGHRAMAIVANGGKDQMTPAAWGRVGAIIREQYKFLDNFANLLDNKDLAITQALVSRAKLYGAALYPSYVSGVRAREKAGGATEERSVLTPRDGWCDLCVSEAARDWVAMGDLVPIGDRTCLIRCRCSYETR